MLYILLKLLKAMFYDIEYLSNNYNYQLDNYNKNIDEKYKYFSFIMSMISHEGNEMILVIFFSRKMIHHTFLYNYRLFSRMSLYTKVE